MEYIAFDAHKHYTLASVVAPDGQLMREERIEHARGALREFLERCERGSPVAVETIGNWYWIVDEIEAAGCLPRLVHARKAKLMMGELNKTDKLDARGLNRLQRNGTLPTVWIPPGELRAQRDLPRTRMVFVRQRTQLKNRIHATLAKYALHDVEVSDLFGVRGRALLRERFELLPPHTAYASQQLARADRGAGPPGARVRTADSGQVQADAGDSTAADPAGRGAHARRCDRPRGGRCRPVCQRREAGRLCGHHAARSREREEDPFRAVASGCQSLPQVGVRRGRERDLSAPWARGPPPRESPL
jgi:transposase